ncbi:glycosyltransferase [Hyunsoonleella flava]|uniref:Glycosyltransferase n=1 Tax=Hyunsoonleella flava TaxID=2527939 RepID=A0A4Q9FFU7_9FLAO|nr:glycosyltransferase [Hyunsoonleella flava]TBN03615.1 glycosyltransferase [Hyunsoonleella flava]
MRILQLIDTMEAGGAERIAVNFANALVGAVDASFLCTTRKEGPLRQSLSIEVGYLFLKRKSTLDLKAIKRLNKFIRNNGITHVHAHATSFFIATVAKISRPKLKVIWHDHYGQSEFLDSRPKTVLKLCSKYFDHIFCVNSKLKAWSEHNLKTKSIAYLPNFAELDDSETLVTELKGVSGKRILCLANLRPQKDHLTLLKAFKEINKGFKDWSLHLIGKDFEDDYSETIKAHIENQELKNKVFLYGSCPDVSATLKQCEIGVLSSKSEGLPIALLEYGLVGLPVVATDVGDCSLVISNNREGQLVEPQNSFELKNAIELYINNPEKAKLAGEHLKLKVLKDFSNQTIIKKVIDTYQSI